MGRAAVEARAAAYGPQHQGPASSPRNISRTREFNVAMIEAGAGPARPALAGNGLLRRFPEGKPHHRLCGEVEGRGFRPPPHQSPLHRRDSRGRAGGAAGDRAEEPGGSSISAAGRGRFLRIAPSGEPLVIDVNVNPDISTMRASLPAARRHRLPRPRRRYRRGRPAPGARMRASPARCAAPRRRPGVSPPSPPPAAISRPPRSPSCRRSSPSWRSGARRVRATACSSPRTGRPAGFAIFGPIPATEGSYDLYWIATHPRPGGAARAGSCSPRRRSARRRRRARLFIETETGAGYEAAHRLYESCGFPLIATVPDYYRSGCGKAIYGGPLSSEVEHGGVRLQQPVKLSKAYTSIEARQPSTASISTSSACPISAPVSCTFCAIRAAIGARRREADAWKQEAYLGTKWDDWFTGEGGHARLSRRQGDRTRVVNGTCVFQNRETGRASCVPSRSTRASTITR